MWANFWGLGNVIFLELYNIYTDVSRLWKFFAFLCKLYCKIIIIIFTNKIVCLWLQLISKFKNKIK